MAKWLLVDGFNMMFRAFHGLPELTRADGFPTGALHGWVKTLWRLQDLTKPDGMLVFFDLGGAQDRLALHPEYKAHRTEMPEPLQRQIEPIKALTRAMGLVGVEQDGVESDDVLASQAVMLAAAGHEVLIVSSDKDFAQMVGGPIKLLLPPPTARSSACRRNASRTISPSSATLRTIFAGSRESVRKRRQNGWPSLAPSKA
jgi:DNA polymerase-1